MIVGLSITEKLRVSNKQRLFGRSVRVAILWP